MRYAVTGHNAATVKRKAGWDTHGLPGNWEWKIHGITKEDIGTKDVMKTNKACKVDVMKFTDVGGTARKMGYWVNMDDPT